MDLNPSDLTDEFERKVLEATIRVTHSEVGDNSSFLSLNIKLEKLYILKRIYKELDMKFIFMKGNLLSSL